MEKMIQQQQHEIEMLKRREEILKKTVITLVNRDLKK